MLGPVNELKKDEEFVGRVQSWSKATSLEKTKTTDCTCNVDCVRSSTEYYESNQLIQLCTM